MILTKLLGNQLDGEVFTDIAIQTTKSIREPDVAWGSKSYVEKHIKDVYAFTNVEMQDKVQLFIHAGVQEVWLVSEDRKVSYYNQHGVCS